MSIATELVALADRLTAAGVRAAVDPRNVNPPGAWVTAGQLDPDVMCSRLSGLLDVDVYLVSADNGTVNAHNTLSALLVLALGVVGQDVSGPISVSDTVTLPGGGGPLPAYKISTQLHIS